MFYEKLMLILQNRKKSHIFEWYYLTSVLTHTHACVQFFHFINKPSLILHTHRKKRKERETVILLIAKKWNIDDEYKCERIWIFYGEFNKQACTHRERFKHVHFTHYNLQGLHTHFLKAKMMRTSLIHSICIKNKLKCQQMAVEALILQQLMIHTL